MARRAVIEVMDEFSWDVEVICEALIEARILIMNLEEGLDKMRVRLNELKEGVKE